MKDEIRLKITNTKNRLLTLHEVHSQFLKNVSERPAAKRFESRLEVHNETLEVDCFGHTATATPRPILMADGFCAIEYIFYAELRELKLELWRFYLSQDGQIHQNSKADSFICDYDNEIIADQICGRVLKGVLESPLFEPTPDYKG